MDIFKLFRPCQASAGMYRASCRLRGAVPILTVAPSQEVGLNRYFARLSRKWQGNSQLSVRAQFCLRTRSVLSYVRRFTTVESSGPQVPSTSEECPPVISVTAVREAQSCKEVLLALRNGVQSDKNRVEEFSKAASEQFEVLVRAEKFPATLKELCSLLEFWESILLQETLDLWIFRRQPYGVSMLSTVAERALALQREGEIAIEDVLDFVDAFGRFALHYKIAAARGGIRWKMMDPFMNVLVDNRDHLSFDSLVRGLAGLARVGHLPLRSLAHAVIKKRQSKVADLCDKELMLFSEVASRLKFNRTVRSEIYIEFKARLKSMDPMLSCLTLVTFKGTVYDPQIQPLFLAAESHLAPEAYNLPTEVLGRLAVMFANSLYRAKVIDFKKVFLDRLDSLTPRALADLLSYVVRSCNLATHELETVFRHIRTTIALYELKDIKLVLDSLLLPQFRSSEAVESFLECLRIRIREQTEFMATRTTAATLASIFHSLVMHRQFYFPETKLLADVVFTRFIDLPVAHMPLYLNSLATADRHGFGMEFAAKVNNLLGRTDFRGLVKSLVSASQMAYVLSVYRLHNQHWLRHIAMITLRHVRSLPPSRAMNTVSVIDGVASVAFNLSMLRFRCPEFFVYLHSWLENNCEVLPASFYLSKSYIRMLWAMVAQDHYPFTFLATLAKWKPYPKFFSSRNPLLNVLNMVRASVHDRHGVFLLDQDVVRALDKALCSKSVMYPRTVTTYVLKKICKLLGGVNLRRQLTTSELFVIDGAFLKAANGIPVNWPDDFPANPSRVAIEKLTSVGLFPVAVQVFLDTAYLHGSWTLLGQPQMLCNLLQTRGWQVVVITASSFLQAADQHIYLAQCLRQAGVKPCY